MPGKAAPRHLNLGMRFAHVNHPGMLRAARHFDVFSLNCYAADPTEALLAVQKALDMPVLIGEFHFGALDAGLPAPSLFHVKDQRPGRGLCPVSDPGSRPAVQRRRALLRL